MRIPLSQGQFAIIDDADYPLIAGYTWYAQRHRNTFYALASVARNDGTKYKDGRARKTTIKMHRVILSALPGEQVDHEDGDGLNNRRTNLKQATHADNQRNQHHARAKSGAMGVYPTGSPEKPWAAGIKRNGKSFHIGRFPTVAAASDAYREARAQL